MFFLLTIRGTRFVTIFQNIVTVLLVIALILFVVMGLPKVDAVKFFDPDYDGGFFHGGMAGLISAVAIMGWACQGTTMEPVGVVAITEKQKRTVPLGIIVTCLVVAVVYGLMSYVASGVLPYEQVAGQNLSVAAKEIMPQSLFVFFVIGGGVCAIMSSFLMVLVMIRYPLAQMADDGWLLPVFKKKDADGYPFVSYLLVYIVALVPILTGMNVDSAISMLMIPTMLINAYLNVACMVIPRKYPGQFAKRALRIPRFIYDICSILGGVCALIIAVTLFKDLTVSDAIVAACVVIFPLVFSWIALKAKSVDADTLAKARDEIIRSALGEEA